MTFIQDLNAQLLELGFPLARARENSIEQMVEYNRNHTRIICTGDQPNDWKLCHNGAQHPTGFCLHSHGDLCKHPLALTVIPKYRPAHTFKIPVP